MLRKIIRVDMDALLRFSRAARQSRITRQARDRYLVGQSFRRLRRLI